MENTMEHVASVCRPGARTETCRYLTMGAGCACAVGNPELVAFIEARAKEGRMTARAVNCSGRTL
jgi:hypothetical protein